MTTDGLNEHHDTTGNHFKMRTWSGEYIDPYDIQPGQVKLGDIAHHLSMICRYGGATNWHYSVAEHAVYVANWVYRQTGDPRQALAGLHHDDEEYILGDQIRPLKVRPEFAIIVALGDLVRAQIFYELDIPLEGLTDAVHEADKLVCQFEMCSFRDDRPGLDPNTARSLWTRKHHYFVDLCEEFTPPENTQQGEDEA